MKKLFLHIGLPKTGSSTLQSFLYQNTDNLRNFGYLYPRTGIPPKKTLFQHTAQHNLGWIIEKSAKFNPAFGTWKEVHEEIENANVDNIIISAESLGRVKSKKQIAILASELKSYDTKILVYLRRQDLRLESLYTQFVKSGQYAENISSFVQTRKNSSDYYKIIQPWKEAFGINNIIVRPLEKTQIPNICLDILKVVGINDLNSFYEVDYKNTKPGRKAIEIVKFINRFYQDNPEKQREKYARKINKYIRENWSDEKKYRLLSYSDSCKIMEYYEQSNQSVAREYLDRENGVLFYEQLENYEHDNFIIEDLSKEELLSLILALLV